MSRMIILGRDGVVNEGAAEGIRSAQEWIPINGSLEAIGRLKKAGFLVTVASNQPGIARGEFDKKALDAIHDKMERLLAQRGTSLDGVFFCPHAPTDNCLCRKPKPGLLLQIAKQFDISLKDAVVVGDSISDIQVARMVGAQPVLVKTGKGTSNLDKYGPLYDVLVYENLSSFAREWLKTAHG